MELFEARRRDLSLPDAVPPGQQPGSPGTQEQLVDEGHEGQQDDQSGHDHEDGEPRARSIRDGGSVRARP
ncbi:hypothetical protein ACFVY9_15070 [Streptomyces sp. NPDC059544]|uniref:hypothetical protein n=1 Tax=Streptomyces sp. NPDC059544 TaxID=3346861 RepID=UPI003674F459